MGEGTTVTVGADVTYYITLDLDTGEGTVSEPFYRDENYWNRDEKDSPPWR